MNFVVQKIKKLGCQDSNLNCRDQNPMSCHWTTSQSEVCLLSKLLILAGRNRFLQDLA